MRVLSLFPFAAQSFVSLTRVFATPVDQSTPFPDGLHGEQRHQLPPSEVPGVRVKGMEKDPQTCMSYLGYVRLLNCIFYISVVVRVFQDHVVSYNVC